MLQQHNPVPALPASCLCLCFCLCSLSVASSVLVPVDLKASGVLSGRPLAIEAFPQSAGTGVISKTRPALSSRKRLPTPLFSPRPPCFLDPLVFSVSRVCRTWASGKGCRASAMLANAHIAIRKDGSCRMNHLLRNGVKARREINIRADAGSGVGYCRSSTSPVKGSVPAYRTYAEIRTVVPAGIESKEKSTREGSEEAS